MSLPILPTISTFFIVLSAVLIAIGWVLISKRKIEAHKKVMIAGAISALIFSSSTHHVRSSLGTRHSVDRMI